MTTDMFVIYQINDAEKNREYRCRSYVYQIEHGFMITTDNYEISYCAKSSQGLFPAKIRENMESLNPDKWATDQPERGHYESDSMAVKIGAGDDNPAAAPCGVAGEVVCGIFASLFCVVFLSAGQCAIGNGDSFVPHASVARNGSTSNADRWICDFYDTAGGRRRGSTSGTGGSNASAGMVHIRCQTRIARLWNCLNKSNALIVERISIFSTMRAFHSAGM